MTDLWILVLGVGFFAVCALYIAFCDRIVGPDDENLAPATNEESDAQRTAVGR